MEKEWRTPLLNRSEDPQATSTTTNGSGEDVVFGTVPESRNDQRYQDGNKNLGLLSEQKEVSSWFQRRELGEEVRTQLRLALPMVLVNLFQASILVIPLTFVGRIGELELASAALANSIASVCGLYILLGMASALETLCGQAYGAKQYHKLEIYFQRAVFVLLCVCVPITVMYIYIGRLLLLVGQTPEISAKSAEYVVCLIPTLYANAILQPLVKFLQTQSIVKPMVYSGAATLAIHVGLCWLTVHTLGLGYIGGAVATSISFWLNVLILTVYVKASNCCEKTLVKGYSKEMFSDLASFLKLALSSAVMICLEYWSFEAMVLAAGMLPNPELELSSLSICLNTTTVFYMIPLGLSAAASTRVSNELGAGRAYAARRAVVVAVSISFLQSLVVAMTFFLARHVWGSIFSRDAEVMAYVANIMPFLSGTTIFDYFQGVLSGVIRGAGWQSVAALVNLLTFYGVGLPVGIVLAFRFGWASKGLFSGLLVGLACQSLVFGTLTLRTNWEEQAQIAHARQIRALSFKGEANLV